MIGSLTWHITLQDYDLIVFRISPRVGGFALFCELRHRETGQKRTESFTLPPQPADRLLVAAGRLLQEALASGG